MVSTAPAPRPSLLGRSATSSATLDTRVCRRRECRTPDVSMEISCRRRSVCPSPAPFQIPLSTMAPTASAKPASHPAPAAPSAAHPYEQCACTRTTYWTCNFFSLLAPCSLCVLWPGLCAGRLPAHLRGRHSNTNTAVRGQALHVDGTSGGSLPGGAYCNSTLPHGATCNVMCNPGHTRSSVPAATPTTCVAGALTVVQSCNPDSCSVSAPTFGTLGSCTSSLPSGTTCSFTVS